MSLMIKTLLVGIVVASSISLAAAQLGGGANVGAGAGANVGAGGAGFGAGASTGASGSARLNAGGASAGANVGTSAGTRERFASRHRRHLMMRAGTHVHGKAHATIK